MAKPKAQKIREFMLANPQASTEAIAGKFGVTKNYVYVMRSNLKKKLSVSAPSETLEAPQAPQAPQEVNIDAVHKTVFDLVNHPPHYTDGGIETIDFIEAKGLGYHLGNAVKYISRAGKKGTNRGLEDLRKARWYIDRAIEKNEYANPSR